MMDTGREELRKIGTEKERFFSKMTKAIGAAPVLYIMAAFTVSWAIIFHYIPMYGILLAFKKFDLSEGFFGGKWIGLKNYVLFFKDVYAFRIIKNTVVLGFYQLLFGFPAPIIFVLLLNEIRNMGFKRTFQSLSYLPHFVSTVVIVGIIFQLFSYNHGALKDLITWVTGMDKNWLTESGAFRPIYVISGIWQQLGWGTIIYLAALTGINPELYENADIDGVNRFQKVIYITIPALIPTISILFILNTQQIVRVGFEKAYLLQNPATYETSDVIATYVYRRGIEKLQYSYATAVGFLNSVVALLIVLISHWIVRKIRGEGLW